MSALSSPLSPSRRLLAAAILGLSGLPFASHATIIYTADACNPSQGCDQTVNFTPANLGTTVTGDTNPPKPKYQVFVKSLDDPDLLLLHGSGSTVDTRDASDTNKQGPGFTSVLIYPEAGYAWGSIEFQLDSMDKDQALNSGGLTFTAFDQFGNQFDFNALFPHEGNKGENQHYSLHGIDGQLITSLRIHYQDPDADCQRDSTLCNTISDMHNIDVNTQRVPEPGSLALAVIGVVGAGLGRRRQSRA